MQLESTARTAMASISWTYPQDELLALDSGARRPRRRTPVAPGVASTASISATRSKATIRRGGRSARSTTAARCSSSFRRASAQGEAPPLFVVGEAARPSSSIIALRGRYYVVDRLFAAAELRLGERRQQVVRIVRDASTAQRRRGGRSS